MSRLELLIPGVLDNLAAAQAPRLPALNRLLSRAAPWPAPAGDLATLLTRRFGLATDSYPPVAALAGLADLGEAPGWWLRADPVHLQADLHQVLLSERRPDDLGADAAGTLVASLNDSFQELGWRFHAPHARRWYLQLDEAPGISTRPPHEARGRDIRPLLPEGPAARLWRARLTEIQMLLFDHPLNRAREARGLPAVNSVWFWGEGKLPDGVQAPAMEIHGTGPLLRGLTRLANCQLHAPPETATEYLRGADAGALVVLDTLAEDTPSDPAERVRRLETLERDWFAPLLAGLRRGRLRQLLLDVGDGHHYHLTPTRAWQFWRRPRIHVGPPGDGR